MKPLLSFVFIFSFLLAKSQTTPFSFTNKPLSDPEVNSYGRGAQYWNGTSWDNSGAPQIPNGTPTSGAKTFYNRYWWVYCEKGQGQYTFTKASLGNDWWRSIENGLEWCANNGAMFSFGSVMTAWDNQGEIYYDGGWSVYPQYLHNLMQAESITKDWKYANGNIWIPNWNSPSYLSRWRALNDTLKNYIYNWKYTPTTGKWAGKEVKGKDILDFVDLRGFGNYGEWHTYPWGDDGSEPAYAKANDSTFKKIIDIGVDVWGDHPLHIPVGAFDDNPWGEGTAFTTWYALTMNTKYGVLGWRRDNIGDKGLDDILIGNTFTYGNWKADTAIVNRWKYAMITGEPLNGNGTCCPYYWHVRPEINNYHYSSFGNGNYGSNTNAVWDTIRNVIKLTGYRFNFNGGNMPTILYQNSSFMVNLNLRNVGFAPMYQKRWKLFYEIRKSNDSLIQKCESNFNPYLFLPSSTDSVIRDTFVLNANAPISCTNKVVFYFEDTLGVLGKLPLTLNAPSSNSDGSYTIRTNLCIDKQNALAIREEERIPIPNNLYEIYVFPNPSNVGYLNIRVGKMIRKPIIAILTDVSGKVIYQTTSTNDSFSIDINNLSKGNYFIKIYNTFGSFLKMVKFIRS